MTRPVEAPGSFGFDPTVLFMDSGTALKYAETTWRAWLKGADRLRNEATEMLHDGLGKGATAMADIAHCTKAADAFDVQARYASTVVADWWNGSQRLAVVFGEVMREEFAVVGEMAGGGGSNGKKPATGKRSS